MRNPPRGPAAVPIAAAVLALAGVVLLVNASCSRANPGSGGGGTLLAESRDDLKPDAQPGWQAVLSIYSTEIPVEVDQRTQGEYMTLRLLSFNQEVEVERYRSTERAFQLVQMAGEKFEPPLPLLTFPVSSGNQEPWKGILQIGELKRNAEATVSAAKEPLKAKGFEPVDSIRVTVHLKIDGGAPTMATRQLDFWFVKGKGLLKREIDKGSARLPVPDTKAANRG